MPPRKKGTRGGKASASASKGRGSSTASTNAAAAAANDPLSTAGARWIVPNTTSLALGPSHSAGACVRRLFFDSREWVTPLRADVAALLADFEARYDSQHSPIELMKLLWTETGWKWVLLLGCPAGKIRLDWGNSVARAFLENLLPDADTPPLQQVAAILALYILRATWCEGMGLFHLRISPGFLEALVKLTQSHAPALDAVTKTAETDAADEASPPPSADLAYAMHYLLSTSAFFLVPEETDPVPPRGRWPFAHVKRDRKEERDRRLQAALLLGVETELDQLARGKVRSEVVEEIQTESRGHKRQWNASSVQLGDSDDERDGEPETRSRWSTESLHRAKEAYVQSKRHGHETETSAQTSTGDTKPSLLVSPEYDIQAEILALAKAQTRRAAENLADDMSGLAELARAGGRDGEGLLTLFGGAHESRGAQVDPPRDALDDYVRAVEGLLPETQ
ncbi:hypothetical protein RHOSPDRAFT_36036 [Rhodotorula sp. JG-1b]|nr:hypothetical protein RHOSPDRAFT_36036 [Rhodotorula sp. JG-1b]